jgi:hypothetical protein
MSIAYWHIMAVISALTLGLFFYTIYSGNPLSLAQAVLAITAVYSAKRAYDMREADRAFDEAMVGVLKRLSSMKQLNKR